MADATPASGAQPDPKGAVTPQPKKSRRGILLIVLAVLVIAGGLFYWHSTYYEDTDDAQISGHLIQVSARINGQVIKVNVDENQFVTKGTVIAELDPADYQVAVENAEAGLASAKAAAVAARVNVPITSVNTGSNLRSASADVTGSHASVLQAQSQLIAAQARVEQAKANSIKSQSDLERYKPLVAKDVISKQQFDAAVAAADADKAALADAQAQVQASQEAVRVANQREAQSEASYKYAETAPQQVAAQDARAKQAEAQVEAAQAQLDQAKLNLSYTKIVAPANGIVTRKNLELNQNVSPGQNLLTLVSLDDIWITANFKETQLRHVSAGQSVEIHVDSTGRDYQGKVTQVGGATGSVLSLFPPENATGNYVKVVQRIPVRVDFTNLAQEDKDHLLRPGMSVEPKVKVK
ncbi:HlyD family secretion protein [Acidicapsa dinghuensis]|uniref:HlyD family secretion protein n=1 Tax=Acidicapsa dinghuensis TaxID=2218256 RepID=A0ABW1EE67_9BACT|nr:HlyD family secretion protein [Acidicapsa dinghuensis]